MLSTLLVNMKYILIFLLNIIFFLFPLGNGYAGVEDELSKTLKAAYIYRILFYIDWPDEEKRGIDLCVSDDNFLYLKLKEHIQGKKLNNKRVNIMDCALIENNQPLDIVYSSNPDGDFLKKIMTKNSRKKIIIFSYLKDALLKGATFNFFLEDNKLRFEVNLKKIEKFGVKVSSQLLKVARVKQ